MKDTLSLARRSYRRRRLRDAARILPFLGAFLIVLPMLWGRGDTHGTGRDAIYLFTVWAVLIGVAAILARWLHDDPDGAAASTGDDL